MATINFQIQVPITPNWTNIDLLRTSVLNCLATIFKDTEFCRQVSMITSELLENAVKYGDWDRSELSGFKLRVSGDEERVDVEVSNPVDVKGQDVKKIFDTVEQIRSAPNPEEAYRQRLRLVAEQLETDGTSQLGLARIAYEGHCDVSARLDDSGVLFVSASSRQVS